MAGTSLACQTPIHACSYSINACSCFDLKTAQACQQLGSSYYYFGIAWETCTGTICRLLHLDFRDAIAWLSCWFGWYSFAWWTQWFNKGRINSFLGSKVGWWLLRCISSRNWMHNFLSLSYGQGMWSSIPRQCAYFGFAFVENSWETESQSWLGKYIGQSIPSLLACSQTIPQTSPWFLGEPWEQFIVALSWSETGNTGRHMELYVLLSVWTTLQKANLHHHCWILVGSTQHLDVQPQATPQCCFARKPCWPVQNKAWQQISKAFDQELDWWHGGWLVENLMNSSDVIRGLNGVGSIDIHFAIVKQWTLQIAFQFAIFYSKCIQT